MARKTPTIKNNVLNIQSENNEQTLPVEAAEWFDWLEGATTFAYNSPTGNFTARKEQVGNARGGFYWKAYRNQGGRLARVYLGKNAELTVSRLEEAAAKLNEKGNSAGEKDPTANQHSLTPAQNSSRKIPPDAAAIKPQSEPTVAEPVATGFLPSLLAPKLFVPDPKPGLLVRSRLLAKLQQGSTAGLVLLSAPAGFGKSTLVAEWLAQPSSDTGAANAWLVLDKNDNDPARFWFFFASALEPWAAGLGQTLLNQFQQLPLPPVEQLLARLLNPLAALPRPVRLVLDDYHQIENSFIHEGMNFLLDNRPPNLQIVLTTREDPPLALSRRRVRRQLIEIRANDLRFSNEETGRFFREVLRLNLAASQVSALEERTEGWAAALQLAGLSIQSHANVDAFIANVRNNQRFILDYLNEEVLAVQPEEVRNFLLQTSVLPRFNAALAEELTGCPDGPAMLKKLEQQNLFLVPLDHEGRWYRYHHLFADYLFSTLQQEQPEHVALLQEWAAKWFAAHQLPGEAVECALLAKKFDYAATLLEGITFETIRLGEMRTVTRWLETLPKEVISRHFSLWIDYVMVLLTTMQIDKAAQRLEQDLPGFLSQRVLDKNTQAIINFFRACIAETRGDFKAAYEYALQASEEVDEKDDFMRRSIAIALANTNIAMGNLTQAEAELQRLIAQNRLAHRSSDSLLAMLTLCYSLLRRGNMRQARNYAEQILELSRQSSASGEEPDPGLQISYPVILAYFALSEIARESGDLAKASAELARWLETARAAGSFEYEFAALIYQARQHLDRGDFEAARQSLSQANAFEQSHALQNSRGIMIGMYRVLIWLALGELDTARNVLESYKELRKTYFYDLDELYQLAWIKIRLAEGKAGEVEAGLEDLLALANQGEFIRTKIEVLQLQAIIRYQSGDPRLAVEKLAEALRLGEPQNYVATFAAEYATTNKLLATIKKSADKFKVSPHYLNKILKAALLATISGEP